MLMEPRRWVAAPASLTPNAPTVTGVYLSEDEAVEWVWTHTPNGSYVSGYKIIKKPNQTKPRGFDSARWW